MPIGLLINNIKNNIEALEKSHISIRRQRENLPGDYSVIVNLTVLAGFFFRSQTSPLEASSSNNIC